MALKSWLEGRWVEGTGAPSPLVDPTTGAQVAEVRSGGADLGAALDHARRHGGPALRALTFAQRGAILDGLAALIHANREELIDVSRTSGGTTRGDAKFDIDGAAGTLSWYGHLGKKLGDRTFLLDGEAEGVLRSKRFVGQHVLVPRHGVAIHINAFNFPAWGMAEKAAVAWLAGVPVLSKPGTATCALSVRIAELWVESGLLPAGAFSLLTGSIGDLLDHVGPQDCVAFTGGSETGRVVRGHPAIVRHNVRVNIEADSLNASILGPDVEPGSDTFQMFLNDVTRDLIQKAGQKCTAVRRIFVAADRVEETVEALTDRMSRVVVGDPGEKGTEIGPVASPSQHRSVTAGIAELEKVAKVAWRAEAPGGGCFVTPTLFRADGADVPYVHEHEVFGPVATVLPWSGDADELVQLVSRGGGGLVCSVYSDDLAWAGPVVLGLAPWHGRILWGSAKVHDQSPGPGTVLPNLVHGGPGKAGGGEELGGQRGLSFYCQRTAIQADRGLLDRVLGKA
ncbi:MAG: 3,4-dehydroadipyl-CoA semialdehyde dehydrogenase [Alphaproteobacteria bacterium]|nr:3,4-dehydroadipyl-CoA semialdehyde dehydrogenase [Alphaproteobacteria bacterium]